MSRKQNPQAASHVLIKPPNKAQDRAASSSDEEQDDNEDVVEMERNFALFSQRVPVQTSERTEKDEENSSGKESPEASEDEKNTDEDDDDHSEDLVEEKTGQTGLEDLQNRRDCRRYGNTSSILHSKTDLKPGEQILGNATLI